MSDKGQAVIDKMKEGWVAVPTLLEITGWNRNTLRGAISTLARKMGLKVERKRESGVTSYRVAES